MWLWMIAAPASMQARASAAISEGSTGTCGLVAFDVTPLTAHSMMTGSIGNPFVTHDRRTSRRVLWLVCSCDESSSVRRLPFRRDVSLRVPDVAVDSRGARPGRARRELALLQPRRSQPARGQEA